MTGDAYFVDLVFRWTAFEDTLIGRLQYQRV
jgi:hypothetical protein